MSFIIYMLYAVSIMIYNHFLNDLFLLIIITEMEMNKTLHQQQFNQIN